MKNIHKLLIHSKIYNMHLEHRLGEFHANFKINYIS